MIGIERSFFKLFSLINKQIFKYLIFIINYGREDKAIGKRKESESEANRKNNRIYKETRHDLYRGIVKRTRSF